MNKLATAPERRQFGRRWTQVHGWVCIEGRPRQSCVVQNFSETGALLELSASGNLPKHFILAIDAIKFKVGCEVQRELPGMLGVSFKPLEQMAELIAADNAPVSTYERLLALATAEHDMAENAEIIKKVNRIVGINAG